MSLPRTIFISPLIEWSLRNLHRRQITCQLVCQILLWMRKWRSWQCDLLSDEMMELQKMFSFNDKFSKCRLEIKTSSLVQGRIKMSCSLHPLPWRCLVAFMLNIMDCINLFYGFCSHEFSFSIKKVDDIIQTQGQ